MTENEKKQLRKMLVPMSESIRKSWIEAIMLRAEVEQHLAFENGAEPEDLPDIVVRSIESAAVITKRFLDDIAQLKYANHIAKGEL